jgi:hypothetical protein
MDLAVGVCSYTAYNIIWSVCLKVDQETLMTLSPEDSGTRVSQGICIMPSVINLQRAAVLSKRLQPLAVCPIIHLQNSDFGESIQFEYQPTLESILWSLSLDGTEKVRLLAHLLDGSTLSKREWHTFMRVNDPKTGQSLFGDPDKPSFKGLNHLFVMKMVMH